MSATVDSVDCAVGTVLPELALLLDRTLVVATAIASQDFEDVHHDPARAAERGMPDIFMSINSTNGFIDRYVTDIFGPMARIRKVSLRLGVPNLPGDTMTFSGTVTAIATGTDGDVLELAVVGANARGAHVTAQVRLSTHPTPTEDHR